MTDRLYEVSVTQAFEMIHVVRAPNKREARRIIQDLTLARLEPDDPRIVESFPSGHVGSERVNTLVVRAGEFEGPDREICGAELNADSRPCQSERGHSGDHWTPSDQAGKPMWWSTTDREDGSR